MGHEKALDLLEENLAEEKAADEKLSKIAKSSANRTAMS
jgi:ferritin-like metal-binding protein YciE